MTEPRSLSTVRSLLMATALLPAAAAPAAALDCAALKQQTLGWDEASVTTPRRRRQ